MFIHCQFIFCVSPAPVTSQAGQLVVGQEQFRGTPNGDGGWLDGWNEDLALQGGLLWGQLQLLWHTGQDLHRVRQPHTQTHSYSAYSCQQCWQGLQWQGPGIWRGSWWRTHTQILLFSVSKESYRALTKGVQMRVMVIHNDRPLATLSMLQVWPPREKVRALHKREITREQEKREREGRETEREEKNWEFSKGEGIRERNYWEREREGGDLTR